MNSRWVEENKQMQSCETCCVVGGRRFLLNQSGVGAWGGRGAWRGGVTRSWAGPCVPESGGEVLSRGRWEA